MDSKEVFVLEGTVVRDYEVHLHDTYVYRNIENAINMLRCIKEQDLVPVSEGEDFTVHTDTETEYCAGRTNDFAKDFFKYEIIKSRILD